MAGGRSVVGPAPTGSGATGRVVVGPAPTGKGSTGRVIVGPAGAQSAPKQSGGGILGAVSSAGNWVGSKAGLAAHDLKTIPGGIVQVEELMRHGTTAALTGNTKALDQNAKDIKALGRAQAESVSTSLKHPLRDPFQTTVNLLTLGNAGAGGIARVSAASDAARAGEGIGTVGKALVKKPEFAPRLLKVGDEQVPLVASKSALMRGAQKVYDKKLQKAIDTNPDSRLGSHATKRVGGSIAETQRYRDRMQTAPANTLEAQGAKLGRGKGAPPKKVQQAALRLTSENSTAEESAAFHRGQAAKGVSPKENLKQAAIYDKVADHGLLTKDAAGNVAIDAAKFPRLAQIDERLAKGQTEVDKIIAKHGEMTPAGLKTRRDAPGRIRAGGKYDATPSRQGRVAQVREYPGRAKTVTRDMTETEATARLATLDKQYEGFVNRIIPETSQYGGKASQREQLRRNFENAKGKGPRQRTVKSEEFRTAEAKLHATVEKNKGNATADRVAAIIAERDQLREALNSRSGFDTPKPLPSLTETIPGKPRRVQLPTIEASKAGGRFVGGESARPGRGYVPYKTVEPRAPKSGRASAASPVVGKAKSFLTKKPFTGSGLEHGKVPDNTTGLVARHMRAAYRYVNTDSYRKQALRTGSDVRVSSRDVLVRDPALTADKIPQEIDAMLGRKTLTTDELAGHQAAFSDYMQRMIPGLRNKFSEDNAQGIGTQAPKGYKWVDKNVLGDLAKAPLGPRGKFAKAADSVNAAVTAATVYFKIGHIGTRVLTNASTNILQGSADPVSLGRSVTLWKALDHEDRTRALGAAGQHGFEAMPHEGATLAAKVAGKGANWWAKHADAPFRFNSIAYEARKAGFDTLPKFRYFLDKLQDPSGLSPQEFAKIDGAAKEANRAGIAYDRLSTTERQFISRGVWFYPWIAGASRFAAHTLTEHPYKSAILANTGVQGREDQQRELGDLPSYAQGLFDLRGPNSTGRPLTADFSTFSPFSTPADVIDSVVHPGGLAGMLNPVNSAAAGALFGLNQYGEKSHTSRVTDAWNTLTAPTPEAQILNAYLGRKADQSHRMYRTTWQSALERALAGPGLPRRLNVPAAHASAAREKSGN